jgi:hypothetical protein
MEKQKINYRDGNVKTVKKHLSKKHIKDIRPQVIRLNLLHYFCILMIIFLLKIKNLIIQKMRDGY